MTFDVGPLTDLMSEIARTGCVRYARVRPVSRFPTPVTHRTPAYPPFLPSVPDGRVERCGPCTTIM